MSDLIIYGGCLFVFGWSVATILNYTRKAKKCSVCQRPDDHEYMTKTEDGTWQHLTCQKYR